MSTLGKLSFSLAGSLTRVYSFKADDGSQRFAATVDFWGSSVTVFLTSENYDQLLPLSGVSDVRVFGLLVKDRSGLVRLSAQSVEFPGCPNWSDVQPAELAAGVQFFGTCRVKSDPRTFRRKDGSDDIALDVDLFGTSLTFTGFPPSLAAGLSVAQLLQVSGTAEPLSYRANDGKELSSYRLHLLELKKIRVKE